MAKPFKGTINLDIRDSTQDWSAYLANRAPEGAPNVLVVLSRGGVADPLAIHWPKGIAGRGEVRDVAQQHPEKVEELKARWLEEAEKYDGPLRLFIDDEVVAEDEIRTVASRYSLCGEGLCIGYDGGDAVSSEYTPAFEFTGGTIAKVVFDVADDAYVDVEAELAAALARD